MRIASFLNYKSSRVLIDLNCGFERNEKAIREANDVF